MKRASYLIMLVGLYVSILIMGCGSSSTSSSPTSPPVGQDIIQKYNFHIVGEPTIANITLPQQLNDANWGLKETLCEQAGYSLTPFAGQSISSIAYNITEKYASDSLNLVVLAKGETSICGFLSMRNSGSIPGLFAVNDANVK